MHSRHSDAIMRHWDLELATSLPALDEHDAHAMPACLQDGAQALPWSVALLNQETLMRVGIWDAERELQPVRVDLSMSPGAGTGRSGPDYRGIRDWIMVQWPQAPHTPLLETRLRELMDFVFAYDTRIGWVDAALVKPQACPEARGVGVRLTLSREEHERLAQDSALATCQIKE